MMNSESTMTAHSAGEHDAPEHLVVNSATVGHFLSALPLRTKQATRELAATLRELGADPKVIAAAERG